MPRMPKPPYTGPKFKVIAQRQTQHGFVEHGAMYSLPGDNYPESSCRMWIRQNQGIVVHFGIEYKLAVVPHEYQVTPWPERAYMDE